MSVSYINLSTLNLGTLTNGMGISVDTTDVNGNPINLCATTGNFLGATLNTVINAIVNCINSNTPTTNYTATNANPRIRIDYPGVLSLAGISITINITFYYLKNDQENLPDHTALGYTAQTTGRPAYVNLTDSGYANDLLYSPNGDSYPNFTLGKSFNGYTDGSAQITTIGAGLSIVVFGIGQTYVFEHHPNVTDYYLVPFTITGYNNVSGALSFTIGAITKTIAGVTTSNSPIDNLGSVNWLLNLGAPGWGTVNVFNVNKITGVLTLNDFIEVHADTITAAAYDSLSNAVFLCCGGNGRSTAAKIDLTSPLAVASLLDINAGGGQYGINFMQNPFTNLFYINSGDTTISKFDTNTPMGFNLLSNITGADTPYNKATAITFDDSNGDMYYPGVDDVDPTKYAIYKLVVSANINIKDNFGNKIFTFTDTGSAALYTSGNLSSVNAEGLYFHRPTGILYVLRNTDANSEEFQSYDIFAGSSAQINATKQTIQPPNGTPRKMTWQPSAARLFLTTNHQNGTVYFFNPVTDSFDASAVNVPSGVSVFSFTDDGGTPNYFASNGGVTEWLSVISSTSPETLLSGVFLDEALNDSNCPFCYEYPLIACYDNYVFDLDLIANTIYNIILTDKFGKKYRQQVTSDSEGKIMIDPDPFPEGFFTPENGNLTMEITDENNVPVQIIFGYSLYTCLTLTFEYNNLYN